MHRELWFVLLFTFAPFFDLLSIQVKILAAVILFLTSLQSKFPKKLFILVRVVGLLGGIYVSFFRPVEFAELSLIIPIQFLAVLLCLKSAELNSSRDKSLFYLMAILFVLFGLLLKDSLLYLLYLVTYLIMLFSLMNGNAISIKDKIFNDAKTLLKASLLLLPLTFTLFLLFPRVPIPGIVNWNAMSIGKTGLSQQLSPGSIAELILDERVAFVVEGPALELIGPQRMYFYLDFLYQSKGMEWQKGTSPYATELDSRIKTLDLKFNSYNVTLENMRERRLPVLKNTQKLTSNKFMSISKGRDGLFEATYLNSRNYAFEGLYTASNHPAVELIIDHNKLKQQEQLQVSNEVRDLAAELKDQISKVGVESSFNRFFLQNGFLYSLKPGKLESSNHLHEFLLTTKKGFCEHYAASVATLLRLMNIPSRVVLGFLGGDYNNFADTLSVRYLDAHSWVEYWDTKTKKWILYDPVQYLAPDRLSMGADAFYLQSREGEDAYSWKSLRHRFPWLDSGVKILQMSNYKLGQFFIGFDREKQKEIYQQLFDWRKGDTLVEWLRKLVAKKADQSLIALITLFIIVISGIFFFLRSRQEPSGILKKIWQRALLEILGSKNKNNQLAPKELIINGVEVLPIELQVQWLELGDEYLSLAYGKTQDQLNFSQIKLFGKKVKSFLQRHKKFQIQESKGVI